MQGFPRNYEATVIDKPAAGADMVFEAPGAGSRATSVSVEPVGGAAWTADFHVSSPGRRAFTGLVATPSPTCLCVIERGTAFYGDVYDPRGFKVVITDGPIASVTTLVEQRLVVLVSPWSITAIGDRGVCWSTERIARDGIRVDGTRNGWMYGVADPSYDNERPFRVELRSGRVLVDEF